MPFPYLRNITAHTHPMLLSGYQPNPFVDSPGRLRTSVPLTLFEHNNQTGTNIFKWDTLTSGTGTVTDGSGATMGVTTLSTGGTVVGASAIRASRAYLHQAAGKCIWAGQAFSFGPGIAGVAKRVGFYDTNNGCFMELMDGTLSLVIRRAGVDTKIPQGQWTDDNLDGNGPSAIVFNPSAGDIDLRVEMFGSARIRFYVYYNYQFWIIHSATNSNMVSPIAPQTANLPVRAEIVNTGTPTVTASMTLGGTNVFAEGAQEQVPAFVGTKNNGSSPTSVTTRRPVLSIRARTLAINGIDRNFGQIIPQNLSILVTANTLIEVVYNPTLTGASFSQVGPTSIVDGDTSATSLSGGVVANSEYIGAAGGGSNTINALLVNGQNLFEQFPLVYSSLQNTQDIISIVATSMSGTSNVSAALNWTEIY